MEFVRHSRHKCLVYDGDPAEQLPVVVPLLGDALKENWRCLYLGSPEMVTMVDHALEANGVDVHSEVSRGALLLSTDRSHLVAGVFDPDAMVDGLRGSIRGAVEAGYRGLCATGDMRWELGDDENFRRLVEYEAKLERVFHELPLMGICQYHRGFVPEEAITGALTTHPSVWIGNQLTEQNPHFVPPDVLLSSDEQTRGAWMTRQIMRALAAERERDELLRDLERRVAERTRELELANRDLRAFSYSVSHDLRAPLRAIIGFAQALEEDHGAMLAEGGRRQLDRIRSNALRMEERITGLLELFRVMQAGLGHAPVDVSTMAREIARELEARPVELVVQDGMRTTGDPALIRAALENLLSNAWKFTVKKANPRVEVSRAGDEGGMPVFQVRDNGAGLPMEHAARLFRPFQRLHSQEEFAGTGVGLATVARIVERHGGRIWVESTVGEGTAFFFTLPPPAR